MLHLTGARPRAHLIMRILGCLCRRPILLGRLDVASLRTLPVGLVPTLLILDERLARNVATILQTSKTRTTPIAIGKGWIHAYGAKVFFTDSMAIDGSALRINLPHNTSPLSVFEEGLEKKIAADFQAKLLRYRFIHYDAVKNSHFSCAGFGVGMQEEARALITPLIECNDLQKVVLSSLRRQSRDSAGAKFADLHCLTIEAALAFCHDSSVDRFLVKDLADAVNAILHGRGEETVFTARCVGQTLRVIGLFAQRVTRGFQVVLTRANRERIHRLAREYSVASIEEGVLRCDQCTPNAFTTQAPDVRMNV